MNNKNYSKKNTFIHIYFFHVIQMCYNFQVFYDFLIFFTFESHFDSNKSHFDRDIYNVNNLKIKRRQKLFLLNIVYFKF